MTDARSATTPGTDPGTDEPAPVGLDPRIQAVIDRARPLRLDQIDQIRDLLALDGDAADAA
jgi:hypothetical protein